MSENTIPRRKFTTQIIIHSSATPPEMDIGLEEIDQWHRKRGFSKCGYHFIIRRKGVVEVGRNISELGAHAKGQNHSSIGICLVGGTKDNIDNAPENNFTFRQMCSLVVLIEKIQNAWVAKNGPLTRDLLVKGHNEVSDKDCPSFDVKQYLKGCDWLPHHDFIRGILPKVCFNS